MADPRLPVLQPISEPLMPAPVAGPVWAAPSGPDLPELFRRIWRRKRMIAAITVGGTMLAAIVLFLIPPRYTASAQIMLVPAQTKILDSDQLLAGITPDTEAVNSATAVVESRDIAERVIDKLGLAHDPEFNPELDSGPAWLSMLLDPHTYLPAKWADAVASLRSESAGGPVDEMRRNHNRVVEKFLKRLDAGAAGQSRVVTISFQSESPSTASRVANMLAEEYLNAQIEEKFATNQALNSWLDGQVVTLRQQVAAADQAVEDYRSGNGLVQGKGDTLPSQEAAELNTQLVMARTDRAEAEAKLQQAEKLAASPQGIDSAGAVLQSPLIQSLRAQEAEVERSIADLAQTYGEQHPKMLSARAQLQDLEAKIRTEIGRIAKDYRNEVAVARAREASLSASLETIKGQVADLNQSDIHLRSLEREADASRTLLENFLARYKETASEQSLHQPDASIISHASEPEKPSFPKKRILLVLCAGAFAMLSLFIALLREEFDRGVRSAGQIERVIGARALGLIPLARTWLGRPRKPEDYVVDRPASALSESLRSLHTGVALTSRSGPPKIVMFASSLPKEGKSSLALSYARLLANAGKKVVVVDCDLRRSALCRRLGLKRKAGLSDYVRGNAELDDILHPDLRSNACIVPAGTAPATSATDVLASERLAAFLGALGQHYDQVIIDTPPVLAVSDTQILCRLVDKTIFVVRWERTRVETAILAIRQLIDAGADVAGVVLSMVDMKRHARYGYGDASSYYAELRRYYVG
jgi:succinoglycan biosynthesis transport protein ExoP